MDKNIIKFDSTEIEKYKFHQHKSSFLIANIDINKIVVSSKVSFGKRVLNILLAMKMLKKIRPSCMFFQKIGAYRRDFDTTKRMSFLIKNLMKF